VRSLNFFQELARVSAEKGISPEKSRAFARHRRRQSRNATPAITYSF
jgi:hypothetical protein